MPHVIIVGAGISGLATAQALQAALPAAEISVLEAAPRPGGTVWTERQDGYIVELGPNGFLDTQPSTLALCLRLSLGERLVGAGPAARHRYLFWKDRLQPLPEGLGSFLTSPLLSWRAKWSLWAERFAPARTETGDESVYDFAARRACAEVAELFADALVTGIHAGDPKLLSAAAAFPRLVAMERDAGSLQTGMARARRRRRAEARARGEPAPTGSRLISCQGGLRTLIEALAGGLRRPPEYGVAVRRATRGPDGWHVESVAGEVRRADSVVLACPAYRQAEILAGQDAALAGLMRQIAYSPAAVVALGYRREDVPHDLNGFGYIAPQQLRRDVLGVQWCSSIFPDRAPPGHVLVRAIAGGWHRRDVMEWDDDRLLAAVRAELRAALGIEAAPVFSLLTRWDRAIPQYHLGHLDRVAWIESRADTHAGLFLTGNAYHGVALNDCTEQAERVAARVVAFLKPSAGQKLP